MTAALQALLDRVEAGEFPADTSARDLGIASDGLPIIKTMYSAFSGSLDAAKALVEAARKMLVAAELREIYHRLPNDKNRIGDPKSPKAKAKDAWLKAFRQASSATSLALAAIKEPKI